MRSSWRSTSRRRRGRRSSWSPPRTSPPRCRCSPGTRARSRQTSVSPSPVARAPPGFSGSASACRRRRRSPTSCSVLRHSYWWPTAEMSARLSRRFGPAVGYGRPAGTPETFPGICDMSADAATAVAILKTVIDPHVIVLEDDPELRSLLTRGLREEGFEVTTAGTASELRAMRPDEEPDAMIVDVGLPDAVGRDLVQALRVQGTTTPVIFLTARDALPDRLAGFAA